MQNASPEIAIAMAVYEPNQKTFLDQLRSIQNQNDKNWICILQFDSPIDPWRTYQDFESIFQDVRFHWNQNPSRLGHKKNFEKATENALKFNPRWIAFSDQDDFWFPEKLFVLKKRIEILPPYSLVHSDMGYWQSKFNQDPTSNFPSVWKLEKRSVWHRSRTHFLIHNTVAGASLLMDARIAKIHPEIPKEWEFHDHWFAFCASSLGQVVPIFIQLYAYRQHEENVVGATKFRGVFAKPLKKKSLFIFFANKYLETKRRYTTTVTIKRKADISSWLLFSSYDFGFLLYLYFVYIFIFSKEPAFARAILSRALGKTLCQIFLITKIS